jgi:YegS/Rv2252/BmrU family lipid kinase
MKPEDGYIAYIVNPKSGASSGKIMISQFKEYLFAHGFEVRTYFTESLPHAGELATRAAVDYDCAMVVVAGGDGTIREAAHGLEGSDKPMLIIPGGTENLLANELGLDERTETLIKTFEAGSLKSLDLGSANGRCFTSIAGFGFDGEVIKRVNDWRKGHIHHLDYFWPLWQAFWEHKFPDLNVVIDGENVFQGQAMVFVGNISRYAIGLKILKDADFGDGMLDVCIYKCLNRPTLVKHSLMTILKMHADRNNVIYRQGKIIEVSSTSPNVQTQIDGDPGPKLPVKIEIIPQAVKVMVPPNAKPAGIRTRLIRIVG